MAELVKIPIEALAFRVSRSSGPGGQNVNKTDSRVEAMVHVASANFLTDEQKQLVMEKLSKRISKEGYLSVACQQSRSQLANKETAIANLEALINKSLQVDKPRKPTKIPRIVQEKRIKRKKENSAKKQLRSNWKKDL
ncbi:alternative ribosome rescue aminoacyl-tRNA hydrolase ArfB [soil metagenome]